MAKLINISWLLITGLQLHSQDVIIQPPLFNSFGCNEFTQTYSATVSNFSQVTFNVNALVEIFYSTANQNGSAKVAEVTIRTNGGISIGPGVTIFDKSTFQTLGTVNVNFQDRSFESMIRDAKCLPPGSYEICFYLYPEGNGESPTQGNFLTRTCYVRTAENFSPLLLVTPFDRDTLSVDLPLFSWTAITPVNMSAFYTIEIVELFGRQTPFEAFRSNPVFYKGSRLASNIHQYPIISRPFNPCSTYAWRVIYNSRGGFDNSAFTKPDDILIDSKLWTFHTACDEEDEDDDDEVVEENLFRVYHDISDFNNPTAVLRLNDYELNLIIDNSYQTEEGFEFKIFSDSDLITTATCCSYNSTDANQSSVVSYGENKFVFDLDELGLEVRKIYRIVIDDYKLKRSLNFIIELK